MDEHLPRWIYDPTIRKFMTALLGLLVIHLLVRLSQRGLSRYIQDTGSRYRARKLAAFLGYAIALIFLLGLFSQRLSEFTLAVGLAGAGVALALQEIILSVGGWLALSVGHFYRTGDRVVLGGIRGDVIDIGIVRTTLMECGQWVDGDLYNGRIVRVANSFVFKEPVVNYSGDFPFLWDEITVPVKYGSDPDLARKILQTITEEVTGNYAPIARETWKNMVRRFRIEDAQTEPLITLTANENWMEFTIRYVVDYQKRRSTKDQIFTRILRELDQTRGQVQLASTSLDVNLIDSH